MKNYFENETTILPFDKVLSIHKNKDSLYICIGFDKGNGIGSSFSIDQLATYKLWLESQSNSSEIQTSCSCSDKANDLVLTREQVTRIIRRIGDCTICKAYQRIGKFEDALVPCKKCEVYSNLNPLDEIVEEINDLIKEK